MAVPLLAYLGIPTGISLAYGLKDWLISAPTKIGVYGKIPKALGIEKTFVETKGVPPYSWAFEAGQETRRGIDQTLYNVSQIPNNIVHSITTPITEGISDVTNSVTGGIKDITGAITSPIKGLTQTITEFKMPDITLPNIPSSASQILLIPQNIADEAKDNKTLMYGAMAVGIALIIAGGASK